jgi:hypothetical protein
MSGYASCIGGARVNYENPAISIVASFGVYAIQPVPTLAEGGEHPPCTFRLAESVRVRRARRRLHSAMPPQP